MRNRALILCGAVLLTQVDFAGGSEPVISAAVMDQNGFLVHSVNAPYQAGTTQIRVLLPEQIQPNHRYPVIYMLPVEAGVESRWGDCVVESKKQSPSVRQQAIFVAPTFSHLPWYADHPTDAGIRQEAYFLTVVLPFVERTYPALDRPAGRLLLGFSKSGWGAWSLLLRHPRVFGRAAAWDAPLMMTQLGQYGSKPIFGSQENFERYRVTDLIRSQAEELKLGKRLMLTGYGNFREHHVRMHALLDEVQVPHVYRDGPQRKHDWNSGWVAEAAEWLLSS